MEEKNLIRVVAGVIVENERFFLVKRPSNKKEGGFWEFPGGKVEKGEDLFQALKRELLEELNIIVKKARYITTEKKEEADRIIEINFFLIEDFEGKISLKEAQEGGFYFIDSLSNFELCSPDKKFIEKILKDKKFLTSFISMDKIF